ncbi:ZWICHEL kinesin-like calmodulin-binding protein [Prunus dulcis]|uniref:ZWICHEL kinesin-like calmodulin-binding protein n=1 Tax=Prunus dulcis TaxID=3755 RepID=A0A4Y1RXJ5_PRUDU|nr:ZWICHEL kinesin-like calmodulin-binding protein [Prunus dulcis]
MRKIPPPPLRRQRLRVVATTTTRSHLGRHRVHWNHHLPYFPFHQTTASIRRRARRNQPRKAAVWTDFTKLSTLRSLSFLHQIGRVRHQEPDRILKGDLRGIEAVEVRGIHHRANYSFRAKGF